MKVTRELIEALAKEIGLKVVLEERKSKKQVTPESKTIERAYPADVAKHWSGVRLKCPVCSKTKVVLSLTIPRQDDFGVREIKKGSGRFGPQARCRQCRSDASREYYHSKPVYRTKNNLG